MSTSLITKSYISFKKGGEREPKEVVLDFDGILRFGRKLCVFMVGKLIRLILEEAHCA